MAEPVEHRIDALAGEGANQRDAGRQAQHAGGQGDRAGNEVGKLVGHEVPPLAAAGLVGDQHEGTAARARHQPWAVEFLAREMGNASGHFLQRAVTGLRAIGHVDRVEPSQGDQHGVDMGMLRGALGIAAPSGNAFAHGVEAGNSGQSVFQPAGMFPRQTFASFAHRLCYSQRPCQTMQNSKGPRHEKGFKMRRDLMNCSQMNAERAFAPLRTGNCND